jgi:hypothetical protein
MGDQSTNLRNPFPDKTDAGKQVYTSLLERRLVIYTLRDIKLRAALELATGVPYDNIDVMDMTNDQIFDMIAQDMSKGLRISLPEARARVAEHRVSANPSQMETPMQAQAKIQARAQG